MIAALFIAGLLLAFFGFVFVAAWVWWKYIWEPLWRKVAEP